ncbi:hypothetical protein [Tepidicaulis marinus]|uniref:hypothetical protein n=1 Tax=Tepidicaulis marinus TaxID=1333998 RepID=UPI0018CD6838|nr:hypothetical protein [Tepidicaulis marinus]
MIFMVLPLFELAVHGRSSIDAEENAFGRMQFPLRQIRTNEPLRGGGIAGARAAVMSAGKSGESAFFFSCHARSGVLIFAVHTVSFGPLLADKGNLWRGRRLIN